MEINDAIIGIAARAAQQYAEQEGDYRDADGLLMCGKCHTQKQVRQPFLGNVKVLACACKCVIEHNRREADAKRKRDRMQYLDSMRRTGFPDAEMRKWVFANDDGGNTKLMSIAHKYVDNFDTMRSNGLDAEMLNDFESDGAPYNYGYGYGYGVRTLIDKARGNHNGSLGSFGWTGGFGTWCEADPEDAVSIVYMHNQSPNMELYYHHHVRNVAYGCLE